MKEVNRDARWKKKSVERDVFKSISSVRIISKRKKIFKISHHC